MKNSKKLKLTLMILICTLIILVGFLGIYLKKGNLYKNIMPKYELASDLKGSTVLEFEIDEGTEKIYYDKDGKKVDSAEVTEENEKDYKTEDVLINAKENLIEDNYKKSVDIMKQRLNFLQADQYRIDLDEKTGKIVLTYDDDYPDDIKNFLPMEAKFELVDSNTKDVILTYTDFTKAEATYAALDAMGDGGYSVYINLKLNASGIEKINNMDKYKANVDSENEESKANEAKVLFDGEEIVVISYDNIVLNNKILRITTGDNLTTDSEINSKLNTSMLVSKLATIGKMPVIYNIAAEEYINSSVANYLEYIVIGIAAICIVISIYLIIRYKSNGLLSVISFAANIALFLTLIRLTDIRISLNGIAGILGLVILNTILIDNILKCIRNTEKTFAENIKSAYINTIDAFVVMLIVFIVFAFSNMTVINSMGLLVFWGWTFVLLGNLILTVPMLSIANKK